ncbi:putative short-chain type dehydrogenase/reductase y4lA [Mycobacterium saskatchewanense]|uniref:Oxidoreductase n=1 Tax=Mycobacterium saskatchewanense TaxID=220927 RepID=A0AAJ3NS73_9MYCO|nr:SDR family oxidoreductase [Mycobacterium saskatchewanense]ORW72926.1 hypothetical protein AWC23_08710 [Mycobacterium saskatchewanense]BBX62545.1 putative short-chain type dehydrogenase/reductase y4lA [Mycobacterium saskatchewanense]
MRALDDKVILVAGGGSGIGAAAACRLGQEGATVAVGDLDADAARDTAGKIESAGGRAIGLCYDQGDEESIKKLVQSTTKTLGGLHGVHANAADLRPEHLKADRALLQMDVATWTRTLSVNLVGYAVIIRESLPHLLAAGGGAIVCTSSSASQQGLPAQPAYAASKAGIESLVRHLATRYGRDGIRANAIAPGIVLTEAARRAQTEESMAAFRASTHSPRVGVPEDIAAAVAYLMSQDGEWVNGQVWEIDGGMVYR